MTKKITDLYQKVQAETATPGQRVIMVYTAIVKNLKIAIDAFATDLPQRFETINNALQLAENLIIELQLALDKEKGGEIAKNLESLYIFMRRHISDGNVEKNPAKIKEVLKLVEDLLKSWTAAEKKVRSEAAPKDNV